MKAFFKHLLAHYRSSGKLPAAESAKNDSDKRPEANLIETSNVSKHVLPPRLARKKGRWNSEYASCSTGLSDLKKVQTAAAVIGHRVPLKHVQTQVMHAEATIYTQNESQRDTYLDGVPYKSTDQTAEVENSGMATESRPTRATKPDHNSGTMHKGKMAPRRGTRHGPRPSGSQQLGLDNDKAHIKHAPANKRKAECEEGEGSNSSGRPKRTRRVPERFK